MTDQEPKPPAGKTRDANTNAKGADERKPSRQEREASALRANLAKRKAQKRGRTSLAKPTVGEPTGH
ncbi:MAG: hypothetical protein AAFX39_12660 [Pseudomonadota bacterium]